MQKWKRILNELKDMEKDGFSVNHPIHIATMATAAFYEASFNASLATAKEAQQLATVAEFATPTATHVPFVASLMSAVGTTTTTSNDSYAEDDDEDEYEYDEYEDEDEA